MSQEQSFDEPGSHPLLQSDYLTPVRTPIRETSPPADQITTSTPSGQTSNQRPTEEFTPSRQSLQARENTHEYDLHADLHWTINPRNPRNWTKPKKWMHTIWCCGITCTIMMGASNATLARSSLMDEFHTSSTVAVLPTSLYLLGLALGHCGGYLTASFGRKTTYMVCAPFFAVFILAAGLVKNTYGLAICRLFASLAAAPALQLGYASITDIWVAKDVVVPLACYLSSLYLGSALGSAISGAIVWRHHWRWTQFVILLIFSALFVPILKTDDTCKATILRNGRKEGIKARIFKHGVGTHFLEPLRMLFCHPIVLLCGVLNASNFGVFYAILTAFPTILDKKHSFGAGAQGLSYLGMSFGVVSALTIELCHQTWCYKPRAFIYKEEKATEEEKTLYTGKRASKYSSHTSITASTEGISLGRSSRRSNLLQSLKRLSIPMGKTFEQSNPEWRRNMKLAYAATGYINGIDENCGRRVKPERVNNLLDQKLDFSQLCTSLESLKLKFDRVQLAKVLMEALADESETPATYPQSVNGDIEHNRDAPATALENPSTTPKTSSNEKRKTWIPPTTSPPPEWRLWLAIPASALVAASLFILGWTTDHHWIASIIAMATFAFASLLVLMSTTLYILECFESSQSGATLAGMSMLMYSFGFAFSLFSIEELKLGPGIGMSVYAIISSIMASVPLILYSYGPSLRKRRSSGQRK